MKGDEEIRASLKGGDSWEINRKAEDEGEILFKNSVASPSGARQDRQTRRRDEEERCLVITNYFSNTKMHGCKNSVRGSVTSNILLTRN